MMQHSASEPPEVLRFVGREHSFEVPAGADFIRIVFSQFFPHDQKDVEVVHLLPNLHAQKLRSTLIEPRIHLSSFPIDPNGKGDGTTIRSARAVPLLSRENRSDHLASLSEVFGALGSVKAQAWQGESHASFSPPDLLVIHDGAGCWRHYSEPKAATGTGGQLSALGLVKAVLQQPTTSGFPRVIVDIDGEIPDLAALTDPSERSSVWRELLSDENCKKVCVLCSSTTLRHADAMISRHLSWEKSVEDLVMEMRLFPRLQPLCKCGHLIVRYGIVAAVHLYDAGTQRGTQKLGQFVFAPLAPEGVYRDRERDGDMPGYKSILAAALVKQMAMAKLGQAMACDVPKAFQRGLRDGLLACMLAFDRGYSVDSNADDDGGHAFGEAVVAQAMGKLAAALKDGYEGARKQAAKSGERWNPHHTIGFAPIPEIVLRTSPDDLVHPHEARRGDDTWQILRDAFDAIPDSTSDADIPRSPRRPTPGSLAARINVGTAIVLFGMDAVLNRDFEDVEIGTFAGRQGALQRILRRPDVVLHAGDCSDCITLSESQLPSLQLGDLSSRRHSNGRAEPSSTHENPGCPTPRHLYVPVIKIGDLILIERQEIEAVRSARNLIASYVRDVEGGRRRTDPISLAVFAPPGSGKSFAVRQIVESVNKTRPKGARALKLLEFNVAQFRSVDDLERAAQRISSANHKEGLPVVLFDEFDCEKDGHRLGWLKYFLAPMQDGAFYGTNDRIALGPAILFFAGGVYPTFREFCSAGASAQSDPDVDRASGLSAKEFRDRKGPDFVSRLLGHFDLVSIDRSPGMYKYVVRRAILLRQFLERKGVVVETGGWRIANIDEDVVHALLTIDRFNHGVRSLEAIVRMCTPIGGRIEKASLPAPSQLNMHVDARKFFIRMNRGRLRRYGGGESGSGAVRPSNTPDGGSAGPTGGAPAPGREPGRYPGDVATSDETAKTEGQQPKGDQR